MRITEIITGGHRVFERLLGLKSPTLGQGTPNSKKTIKLDIEIQGSTTSGTSQSASQSPASRNGTPQSISERNGSIAIRTQIVSHNFGRSVDRSCTEDHARTVHEGPNDILSPGNPACSGFIGLNSSFVFVQLPRLPQFGRESPP